MSDQCQKVVFDPPPPYGCSHRCTRKATTTTGNGKRYCTQHAKRLLRHAKPSE